MLNNIHTHQNILIWKTIVAAFVSVGMYMLLGFRFIVIGFREQTSYIENKIPKATLCGATPFASVSLTSKLTFYIHIFWDKTFAEKFQVQIF